MREKPHITATIIDILQFHKAGANTINKACAEIMKGLDIEETGPDHKCTETPVSCADISYCKKCGFIFPFK